MATFVKVGEAAHDAERAALRFLQEGLPGDYFIFGNAWITEASGSVYELDAVVAAPHAFFVVEVKSYRARVTGNDNDWYVPHPIPSPLKLNRKTAQILKSALKRESYDAGRVWVQGLVFLSAASSVEIRGPASRDRVHTRKTILQAIKEPELVRRLSGRGVPVQASTSVQNELFRLLKGSKRGPAPVRRIREYELLDTLERGERFVEHHARNTLLRDDPRQQRVLRVYSIPALASDEQRGRVVERARWEAQVLGRLGRCPQILKADPPFEDEAGIVLPLERFEGVTLETWLEQHDKQLSKLRNQENLRSRVELWTKLAGAMEQAHKHGVVHRLLRPDVVLVGGTPTDPDVRITGFDLAKQTDATATVSWTALDDERLRFAAPEVVRSFSDAGPWSDQFSLGALLAHILCGRPLFESTRSLMEQGRLITRPQDLYARLPQTMGLAVERMLSLRASDRFGELSEAVKAVRAALRPDAEATLPLVDPSEAIDPDNLRPGTRIEPDYEITDRLGEGGMAVVYAARHLVSGRTRALKVARDTAPATDALQGEFRTLDRLRHDRIVSVVDLSRMVAGRLTLVMDRVGGTTLRRWLQKNPEADVATRRRYAEDLLSALAFLEQEGMVHKDIKPDNLLVGDGGLTLIDFSLAEVPDDAVFGGTALYRDPADFAWTPSSDRYAAALCLFELFVGRHAFDGRAPEPGEEPILQPDEVEPTGLSDFFASALSPRPDDRPPSVPGLRQSLLEALGGVAPTPLPEQVDTSAEAIDATTDLRRCGLSRRAVNQLHRAGHRSAGDLVALSEVAVRRMPGVGSKTASEILELQRSLRERGVEPTRKPIPGEPPILPALTSSQAPTSDLDLSPGLATAISDAGFSSVADLAGATRSELLRVPGLGEGRFAALVEALHAYADRLSAGPPSGPPTLDAVWRLAAAPLSAQQKAAAEGCLGLREAPKTQAEVAADLGVTQPTVSTLWGAALERLDPKPLAEPASTVEHLLEGTGGILPLSTLAGRLDERWPAGEIRPEGIVRLLLHRAGDRARALEVDGASCPVVAQSLFPDGALRTLVHEALRIAGSWPPVEPSAARRALRVALPEYDRDPLELARRLCTDVRTMEGGELFIPPVDPQHSIKLVLERERPPVTIEALEGRVHEVFDGFAPFPDRGHLVDVLAALGYQLDGELVKEAGDPSLSLAPANADPLPAELGPELTHEQRVAAMLLEAKELHGFRLVVTPPGLHATIGPSVAKALGGTWLSLENAFFERHSADLSRLERAERFKAQRRVLARAVEDLLDDLVETHGEPGRALVLGDTALLGLAGCLDAIRHLYDRTRDGRLGFWVLTIPGVLRERQPFFNESTPVFHDGATLPLNRPIAEAAA